VANVKVINQDGRSAYTDASGKYNLSGLPAGSNGLAPAKDGMIFSPSLAQVKLPVTNSPQDFKAYQQCPDFVLNGSFEDSTAWQQPVTEYTAGYTTSAAHTGARAMRTGITSAAQNKYSYSSTRQPILIPAGTTNAILRMWLYPVSSDTSTLAMPSLPSSLEMDSETLGTDGQYVLVTDIYNQFTGVTDPYDPDSGRLLQTLLWMRSNEQQWGLYEFNLSKFASPTEDVWIKVQAGTYNDGYGGVTSMYVDDVVLELCDAGAAPVEPTPPTTPTGCSNSFYNSDFELVDSGWSIPVTAFSARYSWDVAYSGNQSLRTGIVDTAKNIYSFSDGWQLAYIPSNATSATLNMRIYPNSSQVLAGNETAAAMLPAAPQAGEMFGETALAGDMQYVLLLDQYGYILETLWWERWNYTTWMPLSFDLSDYAGSYVRIQFGTYNDGYDGITAMYVDDTFLDVCTGTTPSPTPTPGPTPVPQPTPVPGTCNEGFLNTGFENDEGWDIPITVFSAGYSTDAAHTGVRSMRNGIPYYVMDRYSYSDAYQVASIPLTVDTSTIGMWIYPISGELATASVENQPTAELLTSETSAGDVQYVLVLDKYGNWIDTLLWQRKNSQVWTFHEFDVSKWIGTTIRLQFGVYNNGYGGATSMYVDDTSLQLCP
jgi:hypothetical protein